MILNQLAKRGPLSYSRVTDSETDSDCWTLAVHELLVSSNQCKIKPVPNTNIYIKHRP